MGGHERQDLVAGLTPHDPITGAVYQSRERTRFFDVARLHRRCSGPCQRNGSWSTWPRSHGVPRSIRRPHRAHKTPPPATFRAQPARNALCLAPYFSITTPSRSPGKSTPTTGPAPNNQRTILKSGGIFRLAWCQALSSLKEPAFCSALALLFDDSEGSSRRCGGLFGRGTLSRFDNRGDLGQDGLRWVE
jgi:hypothetical protein